MKKGTQTRLFIGLLLLMVSMNSFGQNCKDDGLRRKYRLYKERFYRHFIVNDRSNTGCVHDGIGLVLSKDSIQCQFQKQGYGLPATNLWISPNGAGIPGNELNNRMNVDCRNFGISWIGEDDDPKANKKHRFNWLDFGSETLSELGWWLVTLGTEYELKRREGDVKGQQKALEDIFLSLQALRRLDMQAQHLLDRTYAKRSGGELLCTKKQSSQDRIGWWNNCHRNWDVKVKENARFVPDFSGYNGFLIRCDAGQNLEDIFHDPTDETWHVDAIGGAFGALTPVGGSDCPPVDSLCYLARSQFFLSHDQIINLFYGFLFIKKYIPPTAVVRTCEGQEFYPLEMMQKIAQGILSAIQNKRISLPGSKKNCRRPVHLSECEGGDLRPTIYGLKRLNALLQDTTYKSNFYQKTFFKSMSVFPSSFNGEFYLKQSSGFRDLSPNKKKNRRAVYFAKKLHKEILLLGNDLLFPEGEPVAERVGGKAFFRKALCDAPVGGPCHIPADYKKNWPWGGGDKYWPDFDCKNIPGWEGSHWQATNVGDDGLITGWNPPKRANGLDFMALYNMYLLAY